MVFCDLPPTLKSRIFGWTPKILSFSSLISTFLLKVSKFLGKISQFEFLVMTEKNIFAYKLYLSLNISDFNLFFMWKLEPPWKKSPPLSQQPSSNSWGLVKPPPLFWKFGWRLNPPYIKGVGVGADWLNQTNIFKFQLVQGVVFSLGQISFFCFIILMLNHQQKAKLQFFSFSFNYSNLNIVLRGLWSINWKSL